MVIPSIESSSEENDVSRKIPELDDVKEKKGRLKKQNDENKLMHSVVEDDEKKINDGKLLSESINQGMGSLTPEMIFNNLVKDFKLAKKLYGETIIRELSGYNPNYVEKNINIPEFKNQLKKNISEKINDLKADGLLNSDGVVTDNGLTLASLVMYVEELDHLVPKGFGEKKTKSKTHYGDRADYKKYQRGIDSYSDIALKQTIKTTLRRGHNTIHPNDLKSSIKDHEGKITVVYGLDASGSMKGDKLRTAKKAGIALAFKAISEKNNVGLVVFGSDVREILHPSQDFISILRSLTNIRANAETDISRGITKSIDLFPKNNTNHLILLTDALPTKGDVPEEETLRAVSNARSKNITISLIGINLDDKGLGLAKKIVEISNGKLYKVTNLDELDKIILEDYDSLK